MNRPVRALLIPLAAAALGACAAEPEAGATLEEDSLTVNLGAEEQAIRDRVAAWQTAAGESAEAFAAFYAPDGVLLAPNAPPAEGRDAVVATMAPMMEMVEDIRFEVVDIVLAESGELAVERGRYTLSGTMPDGTAWDDEGSYIVAWQKQDGEWWVIRDIFNTDRPADGAGGS